MNAGLPQPFLDRLKLLYPEDTTYAEIVESFSMPKALSIRINTLKTTVEEVQKSLEHQNIAYEPVAWYPDAFIINHLTSRELTALPLYTEGKIYIQSLSSMIPALALDPKPDTRVLDMAAAPGSKTTQLAALMKNTGTIVANDIDRARLFRLKAVVAQLGVTNVTVTNNLGQTLWQRYVEHFDSVLVDAPCSMEGRFSTTDQKSMSHWSPKKVKNLGKLQQWLLRSAVSSTKVGGTIVYSTCTISPEENEMVVDWILEKEAGNVELEEIRIPHLEMQNGFAIYGAKQFSKELVKTKRIVPSSVMEGFYIAKLRKVASNTSS